MHARIATFESDPANVDDAISVVRAQVESGDTPPGLEGEAMRRGDEALNAMNPGGGERRTSVEFYEVPVQTVS